MPILLFSKTQRFHLVRFLADNKELPGGEIGINQKRLSAVLLYLADSKGKISNTNIPINTNELSKKLAEWNEYLQEDYAEVYDERMRPEP